ncbi:MAG: hypothetical protein JRG74_07520 [Deltaproteobacteria bacterium]|jgi:hypothetical protein|nr:hypothetical protein [Deltaproteobacteria bacterium]MBW2742102.1 hypothetical protein [Deltaproteobacteria bacterium]MDL1984627.1 hypothetical protein [Deltaproteobacteria bacterium]
MKEFFRFFVTAIPFTVGMLLSLIALCFLLKFYDRGLDFDNEEFWGFVIFFVVGFPSMIFGINKLSKKTPNQSKADA